MAEYTCVPAAATVAPCPSGTAPQVTVTSTEVPSPYPSFFDHVPQQDVLVGLAMAFAFLLGIGSGRR